MAMTIGPWVERMSGIKHINAGDVLDVCLTPHGMCLDGQFSFFITGTMKSDGTRKSKSVSIRLFEITSPQQSVEAINCAVTEALEQWRAEDKAGKTSSFRDMFGAWEGVEKEKFYECFGVAS